MAWLSMNDTSSAGKTKTIKNNDSFARENCPKSISSDVKLSASSFLTNIVFKRIKSQNPAFCVERKKGLVADVILKHCKCC